MYPVTGDLHEAEEIVQEAFARASTRWSRLRDYDVPEAWVRRGGGELPPRPGRPPPPPARAPPAAFGPVARAEALRTLPVHQRQAIALHHLVDLPVEEVAATLGTRTGTVKSWLAPGPPPPPARPPAPRRG